MKNFYYNLDDAGFSDADGEKIPLCVPELYYQEHAVWKFFLRDRSNHECDLSDIVAWSAAVDCDFTSGSAPMCRARDTDIQVDTSEGSVTVRLDANTAEFLAAVDGLQRKTAYFELCGLDAESGRQLCLCFEIRARMALDPDPAAAPSVHDTFATKNYTALAISGALVSAHADAVQTAHEALSGAIMSNAEIDTRIGDYRISATSGGGLAVSGSGASLVLSGGEIAASGMNGEFLRLGDSNGNPTVSFGNASASLEIGGANPEDINIFTPGGGEAAVNGSSVATKPWVNSQNFARQLVASTDSETTDAAISVLSGGKSYIYTQPLASLSVASVVNTAAEDRLKFSLSSGATVTFPASCGICPADFNFEGGKSYLVAVTGGDIIAAEYTPGVTE